MVGERRDYLGLGKAELLWKFHACLSLSQPSAPCKATGRTVSCGCQLPGPRGCLPRKVQPGAIWEASDILHTGAAQVGPHTGFPGPSCLPGPSGSSPRERWQQMGPLLTSTGFLSTTESATQPKTPFSRLQTLRADGGMLGGTLESESECSAMGVLSGSRMLRVCLPGEIDGTHTRLTPGETVPLSFQFAEQMTWLKNAQLTGWRQWRLPALLMPGINKHVGNVWERLQTPKKKSS